jgi:hypothetical protein
VIAKSSTLYEAKKEVLNQGALKSSKGQRQFLKFVIYLVSTLRGDTKLIYDQGFYETKKVEKHLFFNKFFCLKCNVIQSILHIFLNLGLLVTTPT